MSNISSFICLMMPGWSCDPVMENDLPLPVWLGVGLEVGLGMLTWPYAKIVRVWVRGRLRRRGRLRLRLRDRGRGTDLAVGEDGAVPPLEGLVEEGRACGDTGEMHGEIRGDTGRCGEM